MKENVKKLLNETGTSLMSSLAYDTAWVARLGKIAPEISKQAMDWLTNNQLPDGSWGTENPYYYHDRIISTLAAMIVLSEVSRGTKYKKLIDRGLQALEVLTIGATKGLLADPNGATVGFEMLVPTLVAEAERLKLINHQGERILGKISKMRKAKIAQLKGKLISKYHTTAFSAEFVGPDGLAKLDLTNLQENNGSIGHSPAATAFYLMEINPGDTKAIDYLRTAITPDGGFCDLYPFENFERAWVLWNLLLVEKWDEDIVGLMRPHLDNLFEAWKPGKGISYSAHSCIPIDADNTIYAYDMLEQHNYPVDIDAILALEEDDHFRCYDLEVGISPSVNIHAMHMFLKKGYDPTHPMIKKIIKFLDTVKYENAYWTDKWHASPYYSATHYIIACAGYLNHLAQPSIDWVLANQNKDGSWGFYMPTAEETAQSLQALSIWEKKTGEDVDNAIKKGAAWLKQNMEPPYPPLWLGKGLYCPKLIVRSTILSALTMINNQ